MTYTEVWVVLWNSNPEDRGPVAVYDNIEDAKTHADEGEWTTDGFGSWWNGSYTIETVPYWRATR